MNYEVKDIKLAPGGHRKIQWVKNNMPVLSQLEKEFEKAKPFENVISMQGVSRRRSCTFSNGKQCIEHSG